jgi:hypothetical protein
MKTIKTLILIAMLALGLNVYASPPAAVPVPTYQSVNSLDVVARPGFYLNKYVTVKGKFDKFSTLGLDYKPAMRSSEEYISFLIQRPDIKDHNVPLSEMKIFMKRKDAEKYIELNPGDEVEFSGRIFSNALGDVWMDAERFSVLDAKSKK